MRGPAIDKAIQYVRTVSRMKPSMVMSRLRRVRKVSNIAPLKEFYPSIAMETLDCEAEYVSRFDIDNLAQNEFLLINERHEVDTKKWSVSEASHLWNFNLHYFEYCIALAARYRSKGTWEDVDQFKRLVYSWMDSCEYPQGDAWHPYTISLRLVNWLICLDLFGDAIASDLLFMKKISESIYRQYRHLLVNLEDHLLANHYLENLKSLIICALVFDEKEVLSRIERIYLNQLDEQILPDGVHFERSMMYHKLILEGLIRVELAYRSAGKIAPSKISKKAKQMLDAMASIERGMGKTPFFNDSADGVARESAQLVGACREVYGYVPDDGKVSFPDSGFYKLYDGDAALVFFAGEPGPTYMLGHAHCDLLSFELSIKGKPVMVNSGTYAYQTALRPYFRGVGAHNTAAVNGEEQMECWAEHRVARGIRHLEVEGIGDDHVIASFRNCWKRLHRRAITLCDGTLTIEDLFDGMPEHTVEFVHFAPGVSVSTNSISSNGSIRSCRYDYSPLFGVKLTNGELLTFESDSLNLKTTFILQGIQR